MFYTLIDLEMPKTFYFFKLPPEAGTELSELWDST